ncbi:hypothetical protein COP2_044166 [Malus domestica]
MTFAPWLLRTHFFFDTTKTGAEVVLYLRFIITTLDVIFPSLLTDNYSAFRNDKYGWINWYLVGKFVKKNLFALHLFDELPKRWRENNMAITESMKERFSNKYFPSDPSNNHSIPQTILFLRKLCRTNCEEQGRAAANTYYQLLPSQSDNNVKLIVLDRLTELKSSHREVVADMFLDMLRALSSHNLDIRRKTLDIVFSLVTCTNINELVLILKREVVTAHTGELEKNGEYRKMLIQAIHYCAIKFPEVASTLVHLLMEFLGGSNVASFVDMIVLIQVIIETNPRVKVSIITKLLDTFYQIRASRVCSSGLWIFAACCTSLPEFKGGTASIKQCLSELPFLSVSEEESNDSSQTVQQVNSMTVSFKRPTILADGTYATHHAASGIAFSPPTLFQGSVASRNLRSLLLTCDFFLGTIVAYPLIKLALRLEGVQPSKVEVNKPFSRALLIVVSMLQLGQSPVLPHPIDNDSYAGMVLCIRLLCNTGDEVRKIWLKSCCQSFVDMLSKKQLRETKEIKATAQISQAQPVRLLLHGAISGALYAGHIHSLLQMECITESFLRGLSWLLRFIDKWIHSMDLENHKLNPRIEHYGCIVDLLNRANLLNVAEKFIRDMPTQPDVVIWGSLLFTCRIYGNIELAELVDKRTGVFEPQGAYVNSPRDAGSSLIWDVGHGHQDAVEVLLQNNANLVAENNDSITPLQSSVLVGSLPCLELLVHIDHPNMRITPWEVALILGQWVSDIKKDTKMLVYCALIRLL